MTSSTPSSPPASSAENVQEIPPIGISRTTSKDGSVQIKEPSQSSLLKSQQSSKRLKVGFANRDTETFKWQRTRGVVGSLEVKSEPILQYNADLIPRSVKGREKVFEDGLKAWEDMKLRDEFISACDSLPPEQCCCGFLSDYEATKKEFVSLLNENFIKSANKRLLERGLKIDCFLWNWQNASGKAETNILLIRFFELSSYRFRRASNDEDLEVSQEMEKDSPETKEMARS